MHKILWTVAIAFVAAWAVSAASADNGMSERRCANATLKHHPKILTSRMEDGRTGYCSFTATLPPDLGSGPLSEAAASWRELTLATDLEQATRLSQEVFAPAILSALFAILEEHESTKEFLAVLGFEKEILLECAAAAAMKVNFKSEKPFACPAVLTSHQIVSIF